MYYATDYISPLGRVKLAADGEALIGLWLEGQKYFGGKVKEEFVENRSLPVLENAKDWLDRYFAGKKPKISELPLAPMENPFTAHGKGQAFPTSCKQVSHSAAGTGSLRTFPQRLLRRKSILSFSIRYGVDREKP